MDPIEPTDTQVLNAMLTNWIYDEESFMFYRHTQDGADIELGMFTENGFVRI